MATYDVSLLNNARPVFPPRCVCCELEHPGSTATITVTGAGEAPGWTESILDAATGSTPRRSNTRVTVKPPACPQCAKNLERRHFWKTFWLYIGALGGVAVGFVAMTFITSSVWILLVPIAIGVLTPVIYEMKYPPAFTITPANGNVTYEFRSEKCYNEFTKLNLLPDITSAALPVAGEGTAPAAPPPLPPQN